MSKCMWISILYIFCQNKIYVNGKDGYCSLYGECGSSPTSPTGKLNCEYTGPAKPLTNNTGLQILRKFCPDLADGDSPITCCDTDQLLTLHRNMGLPQQFFARCPSCYYNFLNLFCYQTCYKSMSNFIRVDETKPYSMNKTSVTKISYFVSSDFANGMFDSCKEVQMPSANERAITVFCGRPAADCTIRKWLDYMGDPNNGNAPFKITYDITDNSYVDPSSNVTYYPMAAIATPCNESSHNQSACSCRDCQPDKYLAPEPITIRCNASASNGTNRPLYRTERLVITRPNNHTKVVHTLPGLAVKYVNYTSLFDKEFLHLLLDLQLEIETLTATHNNKTVTFDDVCSRNATRNNSQCITQSILEYWQNDHTNIDRVWWDESGFFVIGDCLDHFDYCSRFPYSTKDDIQGSNMSCLDTNSEPVYPWIVLGGYDEKNYMNATAFMITFVLQNGKADDDNEKVDAWEQALKDFIIEKQTNTTNMTITFTEERSVISVPFCNDSSTYNDFRCCVTLDDPVKCNKPCSRAISYLSTPKLNCHDQVNFEMDIEDDTSSLNLGRNETCPSGFKKISRNYSIPLCLQCNGTMPFETTTSMWTKPTETSISVSTEISTAFNTQSISTDKTNSSKMTTHTQSLSVVSSDATTQAQSKISTNPPTTITNPPTKTTGTTAEKLGGINKFTLAALVLSSVAVLGIGIVIILFIFNRRRRTADFDYMTLHNQSSSVQK